MIKNNVLIDYESKYKFIERSDWGIGSASRYTFSEVSATGQAVFIKEYDSPTYPTSKDTERTRSKLEKSCKMFESHRVSIINAINDAISKYKPTSTTSLGNIVNSTDFFRDKKTNRYMEVVPFVDNINKTSRVVDFKFDDRLYIMKTAIFALSQVHDFGIIHSDLKPERKNSDGSIIDGNIILVKVPFSGNNTAKLIDFDSSYFEAYEKNNEYVYEYCIKGTSGYMSPEFIEFKDDLDYNEEINPNLAKRLTTKADIFSMGVIFHEYLSGKWPEAEGNMTVGHALLSDKDILLDDSIPNSYKNLITWMLSKDHKDRPNASEVFEILKDPNKLSDIPKRNVKMVAIADTWPEDNIEFSEEKVSELEEIIRRGKSTGQYLIGEGFNVDIKTAAELIKMGLAYSRDKGKSGTDKLFADKVKDSGERKDEEKPAEEALCICEPWDEDNIKFIAEAFEEKSNPVSIKKSKRSGQYIFGSGFNADIKTAEELIKMGYAKKKG